MAALVVDATPYAVAGSYTTLLDATTPNAALRSSRRGPYRRRTNCPQSLGASSHTAR